MFFPCAGVRGHRSHSGWEGARVLTRRGESHFVEFAIEQAVELAEKDIESINKV